jgi:hypothetical protein
MVYTIAIAQLGSEDHMQVFIVWKGHRDYEENVAVCATEELADGVLAEHGVKLRHSPGSEHTFAGAQDELLDDELVPWGIEPCEFRGLLPTGSSAGPKARTTDPNTSKAAALANKPRAGSQRARLLQVVIDKGAIGATAEEAAKATGIRLNSASTRMSELVRGGHIREGGTRRTEAIIYFDARRGLPGG